MPRVAAVSSAGKANKGVEMCLLLNLRDPLIAGMVSIQSG